MTQPAPFDPGIPVLTEVLDDVPAPVAPPAEPAVRAAVSYAPAVWRTGGAAAIVTPPVPATAATVQADIGSSDLEQRIVARLMPQLDGIVAQALARLTEDLRGGLQDALGQAIAEAVRHELAPKE